MILMELIDCYAISVMIGDKDRARRLRDQIERHLTSSETIIFDGDLSNSVQIVEINHGKEPYA